VVKLTWSVKKKKISPEKLICHTDSKGKKCIGNGQWIFAFFR